MGFETPCTSERLCARVKQPTFQLDGQDWRKTISVCRPQIRLRRYASVAQVSEASRFKSLDRIHSGEGSHGTKKRRRPAEPDPDATQRVGQPAGNADACRSTDRQPRGFRQRRATKPGLATKRHKTHKSLRKLFVFLCLLWLKLNCGFVVMLGGVKTKDVLSLA